MWCRRCSAPRLSNCGAGAHCCQPALLVAGRRLAQDPNSAQSDVVIELSEQQIIDHVTSRRVATYQQIEPDQVNRIVLEEYARFEGKPIREFIPLFVERHAKEELSKLGAAGRHRRETVA